MCLSTLSLFQGPDPWVIRPEEHRWKGLILTTLWRPPSATYFSNGSHPNDWMLGRFVLNCFWTCAHTHKNQSQVSSIPHKNNHPPPHLVVLPVPDQMSFDEANSESHQSSRRCFFLLFWMGPCHIPMWDPFESLGYPDFSFTDIPWTYCYYHMSVALWGNLCKEVCLPSSQLAGWQESNIWWVDKNQSIAS